MILNCLVIEDEEEPRDELFEIISNLPQVSLVWKAEGILDGLELFKTHRPDVLLLDGTLCDGTALELLHYIEQSGFLLPDIIFVTAYEAIYAPSLLKKPEYKDKIQGFITKPFGRKKDLQQQLTTYLDRIIKFYHQQREKQSTQRLSVLGQWVRTDKSMSVENKFQFFDFDKIIYIEYAERRNHIITNDGKFKVVTTLSLTDLLKKLSLDFVQIHKSFIINWQKIDNTDSTTSCCKLIGITNKSFPIGDNYKQVVKNRFTF